MASATRRHVSSIRPSTAVPSSRLKRYFMSQISPEMELPGIASSDRIVFTLDDKYTVHYMFSGLSESILRAFTLPSWLTRGHALGGVHRPIDARVKPAHDGMGMCANTTFVIPMKMGIQCLPVVSFAIRTVVTGFPLSRE